MVMRSAPVSEDRTAAAPCGAWHPGLESELPRELLPLATVFRPENVTTSLAEALERGDYGGLPPQALVAFRPERCIIPELLVRVTAGVAVPDGTDYEDLGRNFREIASTILNKYIHPRLDDLKHLFEEKRNAASVVIARELSNLFTLRAKPTGDADQTGGTRWPFGLANKKRPPRPEETAEQRERRIILDWSKKAQAADNRLDRLCFRALSRIATAVTARRGRLFADKELLADLAVRLVCNDFGSEAIGEAIAPLIQEAALREGYRPLSAQERAGVMKVQGASASRKSTMRPLQRALAKKLGFPWESFALISPDIWRKFLLNYGSLGAAYKYAGTMTGHEIEIIDKKLDRHMAIKAVRGETSHLLIDRFRFDSFTEGREPTRLLTRVGDSAKLFFVITPPEWTA